MKQTIISILLFTSFFCTYAQSNQKDTLTEFQFSAQQSLSWDSLKTKWDGSFFNPFLKKNKLKISCKNGCEGVTCKVYFEIHEDGHCHPKVITSRCCGKPFTTKQKMEIEKSLMFIWFPPNFYNSTIMVHLGRALKC